MKRSNNDGFTLIELIVVLVIAGLLSGLVMPRVFGALTHVELKSAARDTVSFLRQARDLSYYKKKYTRVSFDLDTGRIILSAYQSKADEEGNIFSGPEMEWVGVKDFFLAGGIVVKQCVQKENTITQGVFDLIFYPAGNTDGALVTLMNKKGKTFAIHTDVITGNTRIVEETNENE